MPSSLTAEERAEINRQNAAKSTGPKSDAGKARSRGNALKHGLRVETLGLPLDGEDAEALQGLAEEWDDYYRPASPGERALIDRAVLATVQLRRGARYQAVALAKQVRGAAVTWDQDQFDALARLEVLLWGDDPAGAVRALRRFAAGCARLLDHWAPLRAALEARGAWNRVERDRAIRLCGYQPSEFAAESSVYLICLYNYGAVEPPDLDGLDWLADPRRIPGNVPERLATDPPAPEVCRDILRDLIARQETRLRDLHAQLVPIDEADRAEAADRALLLTGPDAALLLRYERMHDSAFHRAYGTLLKVQRERARDGDGDQGAHDDNPTPPDERPAPNKANAPDEPDPGPVETAYDPPLASMTQCAEAGGQGPACPSDTAPNKAIAPEVTRGAEQSQIGSTPHPGQPGLVERSIRARVPVS